MVQVLTLAQMTKDSMQDWRSNKYTTRFYSTHNLLVHLTLTSMIWVFSDLQASYKGLPNKLNDESEIIQYVHLAYQQFDSAKINRIWLTLMAVLNLIIEHHGGNDFRLPHLRKGVLDVAGQLPEELTMMAAALYYLDGNN